MGVMKRGPCTCRDKKYFGSFTGSLQTASKFDQFMHQIGLFWYVHVPLNRRRYTKNVQKYGSYNVAVAWLGWLG